MADIKQIKIGSTTYNIRDTSKAPLASPALTGTPTAPTAAQGTSTTQIATTEFVQNAFVDTKYTASTTSIGSASKGTAIAADDITSWDAGTTPTLGDAIDATKISAWNKGTLPAASVTDGVLTFAMGTLPSLTYADRSVPNVTSVGTLPDLKYTARSIPNISVTSKTVVTGITEV